MRCVLIFEKASFKKDCTGLHCTVPSERTFWRAHLPHMTAWSCCHIVWLAVWLCFCRFVSCLSLSSPFTTRASTTVTTVVWLCTTYQAPWTKTFTRLRRRLRLDHLASSAHGKVSTPTLAHPCRALSTDHLPICLSNRMLLSMLSSKSFRGIIGRLSLIYHFSVCFPSNVNSASHTMKPYPSVLPYRVIEALSSSSKSSTLSIYFFVS